MVNEPPASGISALLRTVRSAPPTLPPRPEGRLVWFHLPSDIPADSLQALRDALEDVSVLITQSTVARPGPLHLALPIGRRHMIDRFIAHWQPDLVLWGGPENGLPYVRRVAKAGVPLLFADLAEQGLHPGFRGRQLTEFFQYFPKVLLGEHADLAWFKKHGVKEAQIVPCKPLVEIARPLPENDALFKRMNGALGPRPIWCAAMISRGEIGAILAAHRHAVKAVPNLLLIIVPRALADVVAARIEQESWRLEVISPHTAPDSKAEILLARNSDDLATYMRLSTVSYMGGSLYGPEAADPFEAVAVGSAILAGEKHTPFPHRYARLKDAGALALAGTTSGFPRKLVEVLAPDKAATLAIKGWAVGSEGAETVQILARETSALLEGRP